MTQQAGPSNIHTKLEWVGAELGTANEMPWSEYQSPVESNKGFELLSRSDLQLRHRIPKAPRALHIIGGTAKANTSPMR